MFTDYFFQTFYGLHLYHTYQLIILVCRNTEFYGDEHLGSTTNGNMVHTPATGNYDDSLETRREVLKQENSEGAQEHQYTFTQSEQGYAYENAKQQQMNSAYDASHTNSQNQMHNLDSLSNVMVSYMFIFYNRTMFQWVLKIIVVCDSF